MSIRQPLPPIIVDEGRVCLEILDVHDVVVQAFLGLARLEPVESLNKRSGLLLHIDEEAGSYIRKLF